MPERENQAVLCLKHYTRLLGVQVKSDIGVSRDIEMLKRGRSSQYAK
jgi:hypothetical protein